MHRAARTKTTPPNPNPALTAVHAHPMHRCVNTRRPASWESPANTAVSDRLRDVDRTPTAQTQTPVVQDVDAVYAGAIFPTMADPNARDSEAISFRLGGALLNQLEAQANADGNKSRGEYARKLVVSVLQDEARLQLLEESRALREEVDKLRRDLATTLELVLLNIGRVPQQQVQDFVSKNLRD